NATSSKSARRGGLLTRLIPDFQAAGFTDQTDKLVAVTVPVRASVRLSQVNYLIQRGASPEWGVTKHHSAFRHCGRELKVGTGVVECRAPVDKRNIKPGAVVRIGFLIAHADGEQFIVATIAFGDSAADCSRLLVFRGFNTRDRHINATRHDFKKCSD